MSDATCTRHGQNVSDCPCADSDCERAGNCCECVRYHLERNGLVSCQKAKAKQSVDFRTTVGAFLGGLS